MNIKIRNAELKDLEWINRQYNLIDFLPSDLIDEDIVIAELNSNKAGLGRLQKVGENESELGGIYVLPEYRKFGIARKIVSELVNIGKKYQTIYCLPFAHLQNFYLSFGFNSVVPDSKIPQKVADKHKWCNSNYKDEVLLLAMDLHRKV